MTAYGRNRNQRRGIVAVQVGAMLTVLLGVATLTIDVGQVYSARAELQNVADSAALAGAAAYVTVTMMTVREGTSGSTALGTVKTLATA